MRNCIIILNSANFTGTLNHSIKKSDGSYEKLRVDYKDLLQYLVGEERQLLAAYVVSQQDISNTSTKTLDQLQSNQKFIQRLANFGWTPLRVSYDRESNDMTSVFDSIWQNVISPLLNNDGTFNVNPHLTDIIFVNGSASWYEIIGAFFTKGFSVEVNYPKVATSKLLMANFAFLDITSFLMSSNAKLIEQQNNKNNKDVMNE